MSILEGSFHMADHRDGDRRGKKRKRGWGSTREDIEGTGLATQSAVSVGRNWASVKTPPPSLVGHGWMRTQGITSRSRLLVHGQLPLGSVYYLVLALPPTHTRLLFTDVRIWDPAAHG